MIVVNGNSRQWLLAIMVGFSLVGCNKLEPEKAGPPIASVTTAPPVDDAFWLNLNRRRVDIYRTQLKAAPPVLVVRASHYAFNPTNGMGSIMAGWMAGWQICTSAFPNSWVMPMAGTARSMVASMPARNFPTSGRAAG